MMNRWLWIYFFALVLISHVILPGFEQRDFLFFSTWQMFSGGPRRAVYDISWDQGKTFLFRDKTKEMRQNKLNQSSLFYLTQQNSVDEVKKLFRDQIKNLCQCNDLKIYKIDAAPFEHFVQKKKVSILSEEIL